jgi:uncharacterized protein YkwD
MKNRAPLWLAVFWSVCFCVAGLAQQNSTSNAEHDLFNAANHERSAHGLPALQWSEALASAARKHALKMAGAGTVSHQLPGEPNLAARATQAGARFVWLSENINQGANPAAIQQGWLDSPLHRANLLDADMNSIGVGVAERHGQLFAVEDFSKAR